ncbi:MAG: hypothetical protein R3D57_20975 [Hyphomicrobiaceae bacterium]
MAAACRTNIVMSPRADRTPCEDKALRSLAAALRADQRVRQAEADLMAFNPRLLIGGGFDDSPIRVFVRSRLAG